MRLGDTIRGREWPHRGGWQMSLADLGALSTLQDYDLVVTVIEPSRKRSDSGEIRGRGFVGGPKPVKPAL